MLLVIVEGRVSGSLSVIFGINPSDDLSWAFYLDERVRGGLGAALEFYILDLLLSNLRTSTLVCEVLANNTSVLSLHSKFGFQEVSRRVLTGLNNEDEREVVVLMLEKDRWLEARGRVIEKYDLVLSRFTFEIDPDALLRVKGILEKKSGDF